MAGPCAVWLRWTALSVWLLCACGVVLGGGSVEVDWSAVVRVSRTTSTLQMVMNPLVSRASPVHDVVYAQLAALNSSYSRFQAWFPYPRLSVAELFPPSGLSQCSDVAVGHPIQLSCAKRGGVIKEVEFASFGTPLGTCRSYKEAPTCAAQNATSIIQQSCVGKQKCSVNATTELFGSPCPVSAASYRLSVQVTCDPPQNHTYWDFELLDGVTLDFLNATAGRQPILDLSTQPNWLYWYGDTPTPYHVSDNPNAAAWDYTDQSVLLDPTAEMVGQYFGRVAAWYMRGGFYDEYGEFIASPHHLDIPLWEVLNEMEHSTDIHTYIRIYDQTVKYIRQWADPQHKVQFVGLALEDPTAYDQYTTFLNISNHIPGTPLGPPHSLTSLHHISPLCSHRPHPNLCLSPLPCIALHCVDFISYHRYALPSDRENPTTWEQIFPNFDEFYAVVQKVESIRMELSPTTRTTIDEAGIILPGDNNIPAAGPIQPLYWVAAASGYAYLFSRLSALGVDVVGCSQLMGYPILTDVLGGLTPQYSSVSMVNWTTGVGTARWWGLDLLIKELHIGDQLMQTQVTGDTSVWGQAYLTHSPAGDARKLLLINTRNAVHNVTVEGAAGGVIAIIDEQSGETPARREKVASDTLTFQPFSFGILTYPHRTPTRQQPQRERTRRMRGD